MPDAHPDDYSERLVTLQSARWKQWLDVQAPYRWHIRRIARGTTLEIGCGIGRNLSHLKGRAVGIDSNQACVAEAKKRGFDAFLPEEFLRQAVQPSMQFDNLLFSHVLEHMSAGQAAKLVQEHAHLLKTAGQVIVITPQERGYRSDPTHVNFLGFSELEAIASSTGFRIIRQYSFPFPRWMGRFFLYNEFVSIWQKTA